MDKTSAIGLNGTLYNKSINEDFIVCADGGYRLCQTMGKLPNVIVGDMDSLGNNYNKSIKVVKYNARKNFTDGELAIDYINKLGYKSVNIYGGEGGRPDHIMGNLCLLYKAMKLGIDATIKTNYGDIYIFNMSFSIKTNKNDIISLVPFTDITHIISTEGLEYPLNDAYLDKSTNLGISNIATGETIKVMLDE